ncbi:MAG: ATP-dependent DNA helicase RecG [Anaerolineae bacterium]|nr:ATP-dependent DNA helicase RecG [Anaerolineae bacterium]
MTASVEKLTKILRLEAENGHRDRAVVGGLERFSGTWLQDAGVDFDASAQAWIEDVAECLQAYSHLPGPDERAPALEALLALLAHGPADETVPAPPAPPQPQPVRPAQPARPAEEPAGLEAPITVLRGVGQRQASRMARLGLHTVRDVLFFFPSRYDDFSGLKPINRLEYGEEATVVAKVWDAGTRRTRSGKVLFKAVLADGTGMMEATWFNQPYLAEQIKAGVQIVVSGKVDEYLGRFCFVSPEWEPLRKDLLHTGRLVPVYPLTEGLGARWMRQLIKRTVDHWAPRLPEHLPAAVMEAHGLLGLGDSLQQIHFPDSPEGLEQARYRLAFDEAFVFQLGLMRQRHYWRSFTARQLPIESDMLQQFVLSLPFQLTGAQQRALDEVVNDLRSAYPMNRLIQGDVGSGKTVVAAAAMALTVAAGAQAAMMAPTEILVEQHYATLRRLFESLPGPTPTICLLSGSVTGAEREAIYAGLADGSIDIAVGTHALIQESVVFKDLAMAVIDEQHRFGVRQRAALRQKGQDGVYTPHLLVMTATPIPRSLQLTMWGHLDVSVIDEMPPGRQPVTTRCILPRERERAYTFLRTQIEKGHQAFIICPLVEESDKIEARSAVEEYERLRSVVFPDLKLELLHGRMKSDEKEAKMGAFVRGEADILVATSVVEVGIDVPNATVMLIEGAERFGLSQLHQFRGRVGRGEHASYCLLVSESLSPEAQERLAAVEATSDGFELAQKDLDIRGPGEFMGTRQSGYPMLKMASLADLRLLETAREAARRFFDQDPEMSAPGDALLAARVAQVWDEAGGEVS